MGGFVVDLLDEHGNNEGPRFLPADQTRMTLTAEGVQFLLEYDPDLIPDLSKSSITDRLKAGNLNKALLVVQVMWFCTSCISRLANSLPLSLLEVSTVAHAICTLITYALWWNKPHGIDKPTSIRGERAREALALMRMASAEHLYLFGVFFLGTRAEVDFITEFTSPSGGTSPLPSSAGHEEVLSCPNNEVTVRLTAGRQRLSGTEFTPDPERNHNDPGANFGENLELKALFKESSVPWHAQDRNRGSNVTLLPQDIIRWKLASRAMGRYGISLEVLKRRGERAIPYVRSTSSFEYLSIFSRGAGIPHRKALAIAIFFIYGVAHIIGWNAQFPSLLQKNLWHIATAIITCTGIGYAIAADLVDFAIERSYRRAAVVGTILLGGMMCIVLLVYPTSSLYLLVESFRQLLSLPSDAYKMPSWPNYWPHIS